MDPLTILSANLLSKAAASSSDLVSNFFRAVAERRQDGGNGQDDARLTIPSLEPSVPAPGGPDDLLDLRLPREELQAFEPVFHALKLHWEDASVQVDAFESKLRYLHRFGIQSQSEKHFCMHLPRWLFDSNLRQDRVQVDYIRHSFKPDDRVYLLSKDVNFLNSAFENLFSDWRRVRIDLRFVPWGKVVDIRQLVAQSGGLTDGQRDACLKSAFDLAGLAASGAITLPGDGRSKLTNILIESARVSPGGPGPYLTNLLRNSLLPPGWKDEGIEVITNNPTTAVPNFLSWAIAKGRNTEPGRHEFSALAEFILVALPGFGLDDANFLRGLVRDVPLAYSPQALADF